MEFKHGIRLRGDKFQFTVSNGFDGNGKQIRKYMTYRPPDGLSGRQLKRVVEAAYDDFYVKVTSNQSLKENMRFAELADLYFTQYAPNCLKEITAYTYEGSYRKNIKPVFGNTQLKDLTTARITEFLLELGKTKKPQTVRSCRPRTGTKTTASGEAPSPHQSLRQALHRNTLSDKAFSHRYVNPA